MVLHASVQWALCVLTVGQRRAYVGFAGSMHAPVRERHAAEQSLHALRKAERVHVPVSVLVCGASSSGIDRQEHKRHPSRVRVREGVRCVLVYTGYSCATSTAVLSLAWRTACGRAARQLRPARPRSADAVGSSRPRSEAAEYSLVGRPTEQTVDRSVDRSGRLATVQSKARQTVRPTSLRIVGETIPRTRPVDKRTYTAGAEKTQPHISEPSLYKRPSMYPS